MLNRHWIWINFLIKTETPLTDLLVFWPNFLIHSPNLQPDHSCFIFSIYLSKYLWCTAQPLFYFLKFVDHSLLIFRPVHLIYLFILCSINIPFQTLIPFLSKPLSIYLHLSISAWNYRKQISNHKIICMYDW